MRILSILLFLITFSSVTYAETTFKGYLRTGIGLSSDGGDQVCFRFSDIELGDDTLTLGLALG